MRAGADALDRRPKPFPAGTFMGTLQAEEEERWYNEGASMSVAVRMVDNSLVDGAVEPGARPKYQSVTVIMDNVGLADIEDLDALRETNFILYNNGALLLSLAVALGEVETNEAGEIEDFDVNDFIGNLVNGAFNDTELIFVVENRKAGKKAKDPTRIYDDIIMFMDPAAYDGEGVVEVVEEEPEEVEEDVEEVEEEDVEEEDVEEEDVEEEEEEEEPTPKKKAQKTTARVAKKTATAAKSKAKAVAAKAKGRRRRK